jgi:type ISP restriction-modification system protein/N-6 DNA methylase
MTPFENYFADLCAARVAGTAETSGYPALANLLNEVGGGLKPKITAIIHPSNSGAGLPDGGLFSAKELRKHPDETSLVNLKPERGVLEVKPVGHDLNTLAKTEQVERYLKSYGQILLSNYRSFAIWTWESGRPVPGETFVLADSEASFWELAQNPRDHVILGETLVEYLRRALLGNAPLAAPRDLAEYLASYARTARLRVEAAPVNALAPVSEALGAALGIEFQGEKGEHFFRSTLIQTLFYGVFSAWVLWNEGNPNPRDRFQWRLSQYHLGLPVLRTLFHQLADPQKLRDLGLEEVLDWTEATLARVERGAFFQRFRLGEAVQYFYEPFLAEFDPELRRQFGVWYTPPEIVRYMVARVDDALRDPDGLNIPDGLADPKVVVLDPCCGTGAYLTETLRIIHGRLKENSGEAQAGLQTKIAAQTRIFGFELLPAPYVIAHLQIDLQLAKYGAPLVHEPAKAKKGEKEKTPERAGVFLTNALTGWVPPEEPKTLLFPELAAERDAADHVKREAEILVIIGNPPYSGFAGIAIGEERALSEAYRETKAAPKPQGQGLNELYVRFFRMAERRIVEGAPDEDTTDPQPPSPEARGIICYISNYSWLDGLSHPGMRERFLEVFDRITIDCLNGDKYKTGKKSPDGTPDPSVFSSEHNREGIQVGTAVAMLERWPLELHPTKRAAKPKPAKPHVAEVKFRHWWGKQKRTELLASLGKGMSYERLHPSLPLGMPFVPLDVREDYARWPLLTELWAESFPGVQSKQDNLVVDIDRDRLEKRMIDYFDAKLPDAEMAERHPGSMDGTNASEPHETRAYLRSRGFLPEYLVRYVYRPFDMRWIYWEPETKLLGRKSPALFRNVFPGNLFIEARQRQVKSNFDRGYVVTKLPDNFGSGFSSFFPLLIASNVDRDKTSLGGETPDMFGTDLGSRDGQPLPNLTPFACDYLTKLGAEPEDLFFHVVAVLHAPIYRSENAGALRQDWPRAPLPNSADTLRAGAALGRQVAALLDPETDVPGVTSGKIRPELRGLGELMVAADTRPKTPDLAVVARWGYFGQGGVVMPGPGDVRGGTQGDEFVDVQLNASTRWKDVPTAVWDYALGGYQVLKKWLSYREAALLGRPLRSEEALDFTHNARRIAALLDLSPALDANYAEAASAAEKVKNSQL